MSSFLDFDVQPTAQGPPEDDEEDGSEAKKEDNEEEDVSTWILTSGQPHKAWDSSVVRAPDS